MILLLALAAWAQKPYFLTLVGTAKTITRDGIVFETASGTTVLYADAKSKIWRGQVGHSLTVVQPQDQIMVRFRRDPTRSVILELWANITHVWGRISAVTQTGFEVDENFNADPHSGYRRGKRAIQLNADTTFQDSLKQDLRVGRTVDVIGLEMNSGVQATRVIVYDGNAPVRLP